MTRPLGDKTAIARDQGVSRQTVHAWMADPRWTLGQAFPIDGEAVSAWRTETFSKIRPSNDDVAATGTGPGAAFPADDYSATRRRVDLQLRAEQTLLLRQKRALLDHKYIEREVCDRAMAGLAVEFRRRIEDWLESLPPIFAHQPEGKIRELFVGAYDRLCESMMQLPEIPLAGADETAQMKNGTKVNAAYHMHYANG